MTAMPDRSSLLFHLLARAAADRLTELALAERTALIAVCNVKAAQFPRQVAVLRALLDGLPDAPSGSGGNELWDRSQPAPASAERHRPVSHGAANGPVERRTLERLSRDPGKIDGMRDRVLRALLALHSRPEYGGAMTNNELASAMTTTRDHVHPRIMELEVGGWVERRVEVEGRNGVLFTPTPKAIGWYNSANPAA